MQWCGVKIESRSSPEKRDERGTHPNWEFKHGWKLTHGVAVGCPGGGFYWLTPDAEVKPEFCEAGMVLSEGGAAKVEFFAFSALE